MAMKMRCQEVRKLIQTMPKGGCEQTFRQVSEHLSECEECRKLRADFRKIEEGLMARKLRLDHIASRTRISKGRVFTEIAKTPQTKRAWFLRPAWAGAVAFVLIAAGTLAEVLCRHEAPSPELPYSPDTFTHEPFFPASQQEYTLQPDDTLTMIAESTINLTRREET
jgi:hypothetical protein